MDYEVLEARYLHDHVVWLRFRDGTAGEIDLQDELYGEVFEPLKDPEVFRAFTVHPDFCTLVWPNGADIAPEFLHDNTRREYAESAIPRPNEPDGVDRGTAPELRVSTTSAVVVPEISRFYGIVITMYHREHGTPHFHATYGGQRMSVDIQTGAMRGRLPRNACRLVLEWLLLNRRELLDNWDRARQSQSLQPLPPLE